LTLRADTNYLKDDKNTWKYPPIIDGPSSFEPQAGSFNISGIKFSASPGYKFSKSIYLFFQ
jgi:hypothetical protein